MAAATGAAPTPEPPAPAHPAKVKAAPQPRGTRGCLACSSKNPSLPCPGADTVARPSAPGVPTVRGMFPPAWPAPSPQTGNIRHGPTALYTLSIASPQGVRESSPVPMGLTSARRQLAVMMAAFDVQMRLSGPGAAAAAPAGRPRSWPGGGDWCSRSVSASGRAGACWRPGLLAPIRCHSASPGPQSSPPNSRPTRPVAVLAAHRCGRPSGEEARAVAGSVKIAQLRPGPAVSWTGRFGAG
jgi:hypothetical protein